MKKQLLIGSVLFAAISAFSQSGRMKPKASGLINTKLIAQAKFDSEVMGNTAPSTHANTNAALPSNSGSKTSIVNTWNNITASMNIYGVVISHTKPLQWNDELNAVSFIHRKSPTYSTNGSSSQTETGSIVAEISLDCGITWDSTLVYADVTNRGRYPQGAIYNPPTIPTNTNISNAFVVVNGPITLGTGWVGNYYASKELGAANYNDVPSAVPNAIQYFSSTGPFPPNLPRHNFGSYSFSATDDGKMRSIVGITDDATTSDTAFMVVTGTFNNGVFDWSGKVFNPPTTVDPSDNTENWISRPMMAWNEAGTVGYAMVVGSRIGATGSNVGFQPIVYKTINSGATWSLEQGIDFNSLAFADVKRSISAVTTNSLLEVPFFNWIESMDCIVDANNKLHIFSSVIGHFSNSLDSLGFTSVFGTEGYRWPHTPGARPYLYDFIYDGTSVSPSWSHITIDSMSTEGPGALTTSNGYQDNPWDPDPAQSNQKVRIDARLQMSRTPDGQYIVYTWAESDTAFTNGQKKWNVLPNVKARVMKVSTSTVHPTEINVTNTASGDIANRAMYHYVSPKCRVASTSTVNGPAISMPITVSNSTPYSQLTPNSHWFSWAVLNFGNIPDNQITVCGTAAVVTPTDAVGFSDNTLNSANASYVYPNPAKNNAVVSVNLFANSKVQIEVLNTIGQVVKSVKADGQIGVNDLNIDLTGLAGGIYMVTIKVDNVSSTKKLIIE